MNTHRTLRIIKLAICSFITTLGISACSMPLTVDNSAITQFDLNRYMGKWYEIARYDHRFERGMTQCIATYTPNDDGTISVVNQGMKKGKWKTQEGKAKVTEAPGVLRVSFFWPFYSDYRILLLAPDYSYALVGGSNDKYLWILARTPILKKNVRELILHEVVRRGYKTEKLLWVQ